MNGTANTATNPPTRRRLSIAERVGAMPDTRTAARYLLLNTRGGERGQGWAVGRLGEYLDALGFEGTGTAPLWVPGHEGSLVVWPWCSPALADVAAELLQARHIRLLSVDPINLLEGVTDLPMAPVARTRHRRKPGTVHWYPARIDPRF